MISTGNDANENKIVGQSATQYSTSYVFKTDDTVMRLIDTPGVGDTRGYGQDKKNFENTLRHIAQLDDLHGIDILLKPNQARVNLTFNFCIKELLARLHKSASHNIVFGFTNARGTHWAPGDTLPPLRKILEDSKVDILLDNYYYYYYYYYI